LIDLQKPSPAVREKDHNLLSRSRERIKVREIDDHDL
jgi:hypothetical protein